MKSFSIKMAALVTALAFPSMALAQGCVSEAGSVLTVQENGRQYQAAAIANYTANIAGRDMVNSRGVRLSNFAAVIQQDRANLYKSGYADGDGPFVDSADGYFTTLERRSELSTARYFTSCNMSARETEALKADILNARLQGVIWVVPFNHPDGGLGVYISLVN